MPYDEDPRYWPRIEVAKYVPLSDAPFIIVDRFKKPNFSSSTGQVNEKEGYVLVSGSTGLPPFYFTVGELREYLEEREPGFYWPRTKRRGT